MRIVHVFQAADGGGPAQGLDIASDAVARGDDVLIAMPEPTLPVQIDSRLELVTMDRHPTRTLAGLARNADVVHIHGTRAAAWALPVLATTPSIVTLHGLHPLRRRAGLAHRLTGWCFVSAVASLATRTICVSQADAAELRRVRIPTGRVRVIRNAVPPQVPPSGDERLAARLQFGLPDNALVVASLGRLDEAKDPLTAVAAMKGMPDVTLLLAGDGPLAATVRAAAPPNVSLIGRTDPRPLLAAADLVLNTSRWEGLSLALLEAMWTERAVVASKVDGNVEALGEAALYAPAGDAAAFREAIGRASDERTRRTLAQAARQRVEEQFSHQAMLDATHRLYDEVAKR